MVTVRYEEQMSGGGGGEGGTPAAGGGVTLSHCHTECLLQPELQQRIIMRTTFQSESNSGHLVPLFVMTVLEIHVSFE